MATMTRVYDYDKIGGRLPGSFRNVTSQKDDNENNYAGDQFHSAEFRHKDT